MSITENSIKCAKCHLKTAIKRCFDKKGHCFNCGHDWNLNWKGGKVFSTKVRLQYA
jgi:hypothetical protein